MEYDENMDLVPKYYTDDSGERYCLTNHEKEYCATRLAQERAEISRIIAGLMSQLLEPHIGGRND